MKAIRILIATLCVASVATLSACKTEVKTGNGVDTTVVKTDTAVMNNTYNTPDTVTTHTAPMDTSTSGMRSADTSHKTVGATIDSAGAGMKNAAVEKVVEAKLVVKPGFESVTVGSEPGGVIVLTGTVKSAAEKAQAEATAKGTDGVKRVKNNLTIAK